MGYLFPLYLVLFSVYVLRPSSAALGSSECTFPTIKNGRVITETPLSGFFFSRGDNIRIECNKGFQIKGDAVAYCSTRGSWTQLPVCRYKRKKQIRKPPKRNKRRQYRWMGYKFIWGRPAAYADQQHCEKPTVPKRASLKPDKEFYVEGDKVHIVCDDGYTSSDRETEYACGNDGRFPSLPTCIPVICTLPVLGDQVTIDPYQPLYGYGDSVVFGCEWGYELRSSKTKSLCGKDGKFSNPPSRCQKIFCELGYVLPGIKYYPDEKKYEVGEVVVFRCEEGYEMKNEYETMKCQNNGKFSAPFPHCKKILVRTGCGKPFIPSNGRVNSLKVTEIGDRVLYSCNEGYEIVGSKELTCLSSGKFSSAHPKCHRIYCSSPSKPKNSRVSMSTSLPFAFGTTATYVCDEGYKLVGHKIAICQKSKKFEPEMPVCVAITHCNVPTIPQNGVVEPLFLTNNFGQVVKYSCKEGFDLAGADTSECKENGQFYPAAPTCIRTTNCKAPDAIENGNYSPDSKSNAVGVVVTYECKTGFTLEGSAKTTCQSDGKYSNLAPKCIHSVKCNHPGTISHGQADSSMILHEDGSTITYKCDTNYKMVGKGILTCGKNGKFSPEKPRCEGTCVVPKKLTNGKIQVLNGGTVVEYSCSQGYRLQGEGRATCKADGKFSPAPPTCVLITCGPLSPLENGSQDSRLFSNPVGTIVTHSCSPGYHLDGTSIRTCEDTGKFSGKALSCKKICDLPRKLPANVIVRTDVTTHTVGDEISFVCKSGFVIAGDESATCQKNGEFSSFSVKCQQGLQNRCKTPNSPANGRFVKNADDYVPGSVVEFGCKDTYILIGSAKISCLDSGKWTKSPTCERDDGSCKSRCEYRKGFSCQCDYFCSVYSNCCKDQPIHCRTFKFN